MKKNFLVIFTLIATGCAATFEVVESENPDLADFLDTRNLQATELEPFKVSGILVAPYLSQSIVSNDTYDLRVQIYSDQENSTLTIEYLALPSINLEQKSPISITAKNHHITHGYYWMHEASISNITKMVLIPTDPDIHNLPVILKASSDNFHKTINYNLQLHVERYAAPIH